MATRSHSKKLSQPASASINPVLYPSAVGSVNQHHTSRPPNYPLAPIPYPLAHFFPLPTVAQYYTLVHILIPSGGTPSSVASSPSRTAGPRDQRSLTNRPRPAPARRDSCACQATRRSNEHRAITISVRSASPESPRLPTLNPVEPPWYVTRMPGGVTGTAREGLPMSINRATMPTMGKNGGSCEHGSIGSDPAAHPASRQTVSQGGGQILGGGGGVGRGE